MQKFKHVAANVVLMAGVCGAAFAQQPVKPGFVPAQPNPAQPVNPAGVNPPQVNPNGVVTPGGGTGSRDLGTPPEGETVTFSAFSEPVELSALVDYVAKALNANITIKGALNGQVVFNAPVSVPKTKLVQLLSSLLEQQNFTLTYDATSQFYSVVATNDIGLNLQGELPTTRVFSTPSLRPSTLQTPIALQLGGVQGQILKISPIDEMGVIVVTDTPKRLAAVESLIKKILEEYSKSKFTRIDLKHVAAPVARERILQLIGQATQPRAGQNEGQPQQPQQITAPGAGGRLETIGDRLTIDPQGNSLIFRGQPLEVEQVQSIVTVIDVPNTLVPKQYYAGSSCRQIADIAKNRGLGEVLVIAAPSSSGGFGNFDFNGFNGQGNPGQTNRSSGSSVGGPIMVVDEGKGTIIYYGTQDQQSQLAALIEGLNLKDEQVVLRTYKLRNADAEKMADLVMGIIQNRAPQSSGSPLLPGSSQPQGRVSINGQPNILTISAPDGGSELSLGNGSNVFVIADKPNNQLVVKAPQRQQEDYRKLIEKLDLRRPQVYVEAKIVAVQWTDDLKLAFETQLINAGGTGGVLNTNFGLGSFGTNGITGTKTVGTGNAGATLALIKSDQVPIIINALSKKVDGRILATPQLLIDDNEEGEINSIDKQPYATTTQGTSTTLSSFGGNSEAGTKLKIKPQISEGGYLKLKYEAELSSFTGAAAAGLPPPSQENKIRGDSVTVPSDFTVVVGGLTFDSKSSTKNRVPFFGELPLIGPLFGSTDNQNRKTTLYIFITPRIFRDDAFADSRLNSDGPMSAVKVPETLAPLAPTVMEVPTPTNEGKN